MDDNLSFSQLLKLLRELIGKNESGTLFIRSESNHVITIGLNKGRIYALFHGPKRGRSALSLISQVTSGSYKFEPGVLSGINQDLPSTPEILNQFRLQKRDIPSNPTLTRSHMPNAGISHQKRDRLYQQLQGLLAEYLGPIAQMVVDDAIAESGDFFATPEKAKALINKLTLDIVAPLR
jgi:hypothetical protein